MWGNKFRGTIHRDNNVGNTSSASTLLLISKLIDSGEIKPGEIVIVAMFGAGFTWCVYGFVAPQQIN
jgi:3-oxoacyl-[acyl-carrier-protein] synthase III